MHQTSASQSYWTRTEHVLDYLANSGSFPYLEQGEDVLLDHVPLDAHRILDLGTGDGQLLALLRRQRPESSCVGLDISEPMLTAARKRFARQENIKFLHHDLDDQLPDLGQFDAVVSCLAIHNLATDRQRTLYEDVFDQLAPGGVFCNLEHVASPTRRLHEDFYRAIGPAADCFDDPLNEPLDLATHLQWLRELEFDDVDCYWKWLEIALIIGVKPG